MSLARAMIAALAVLMAFGCTHVPAIEQADAERRTAIRMELASAYYSEGQHTVALREIAQVLELNSRHASALGLQGLIMMQLGEEQQAEQSFRQALRLEPGNPALQNNAGWFYCETNRTAEAMPYFERALSNKTYASPAKALLNAGLCSIRAGDVAGAESYLLRAVESDPRLWLAHARLAQLFYNRANFSRARQHILLAVNGEQTAADNLMMAIRIERKLGDRAAEQSLASQLRRRFPDSPQLAAYLRGETDDR